MPDPVAGDVVEGDLHHQLGAEPLPHELLVGLPAARLAGAALVRAVGLERSSSSRFCFARKPEVWPTMCSWPSSSYMPRISEPTVPSSLPKRKAATTASAVRTRLIFTIPVRSPGRYGASRLLRDHALGHARQPLAGVASRSGVIGRELTGSATTAASRSRRSS